MTSSTLLNEILKKAGELSSSFNRTGIDRDCFVLSTLYFCSEKTAIEGVNEAEMQKLAAIGGEKFGDCKEAYRRLFDLTKNGTVSIFDSVRFYKAQKKTEKDTADAGNEEVTADLFFANVLLEPSENVTACLANFSANNDEQDKEQSKEQVPEKRSERKDKQDEEQSQKQDDSDKKDEESDPTSIDDVFDDLFDWRRGKASRDEKSPDEENLSSLIKKIKAAQKTLLQNVHGQDHAVDGLISGYYQAEIMSFTKSERKSPKATFLFAGPPGVGKTFLAEQAAKVLDLPFMRFDMSEYSDKEANIEFCGSDKVYKDAKKGNVTSFVADNPKCILLFDEIEKAHLNVIHLFLQILDAGRIRDNYTDEEVSFSDTILIFTTNVGRKLYEDSDIRNLSAVSRKQVLNALSTEMNPVNNAPLFPTAICSRFSAGNVIMFNRLDAHDLIRIADREFSQLSKSFKDKTGISVTLDEKVLYALMFAEGGNVDARTVKGRTTGFFCQETFELFRLMTSDDKLLDIGQLKEIKFDVENSADENVARLFKNDNEYGVLFFTSDKIKEKCKKILSKVNVYYADDIASAKEILFNNNVSLILCDVKCGASKSKKHVLNLEDIESVGANFLEYAVQNTHIPTYVFEENSGTITQEEVLSFVKNGARGIIALHADDKCDFEKTILTNCNTANQQNKLLELARQNKVLSFKTRQKVSPKGNRATVTLFDCKLEMAPDVDDSKSILSTVSKPTVRFSNVIGAEDAKDELSYFVDYFKDPIAYMRKGVRAPKGILLYGPPGTGKTLLAKAMAGESDVTFITAEGNSFLKKYVGEGAEKVHELFRMARKYAPSILFIDEIDSIGKSRENLGAENTSADVLTAFLTEMDGFKTQSDKPVFVLCATNYDVDPNSARAIDSALLRRFDRKILVDLPNRTEREKFIRLKTANSDNVVLSDEQIANISVRSTDMSLADLESIFELALRNSIKSKDYVVNDKCLENAFEEYNGGEVKKWDIAQLERTARHEAGHALLCWLSGENPSYLTVVARGSHGGYMQHDGNENKGIYTKDELLARIRTSLAGRAAEVVFYGDNDGISTGASGDLQSATFLAEQMICVYGMDESIGLSAINLNGTDSLYYYRIRDRVNEILFTEFESAKKAIAENIDALNAMVNALLEKEHLTGAEIQKVFSSTCKRN